MTARVLFACKLVFEESKAENQSRQFMETSNRSFHLRSRTGEPKDVDTLMNTLGLLGPKMFYFTVIKEFLGLGLTWPTLMQVIVNCTGV